MKLKEITEALTRDDIRSTERRLRAQFGSRHIGSRHENVQGRRPTGFRRSNIRAPRESDVAPDLHAKIQQLIDKYRK